jgi:hypothetical protein
VARSGPASVERRSCLDGIPFLVLGPVKTRRMDQPMTSSLDELVPADHFYRHLECTPDLAIVRDLVREAYALGGRTERGIRTRAHNWD